MSWLIWYGALSSRPLSSLFELWSCGQKWPCPGDLVRETPFAVVVDFDLLVIFLKKNLKFCQNKASENVICSVGLRLQADNIF